MTVRRTSSRTRSRALQRIGAVLALGALAGCRAPAAAQGAVPSADPSAGAGPAVLPDRAEVVAQADALALAGAHRSGDSGARLVMEAARLRRRLWRLERRPADGLEAVELLRNAGRCAWSGACDARVDRAVLEGELHSDPGETYRAVYFVRAGTHEPACERHADAVLGTLASFKPLPNVLASLDRQAAEERGTAPRASASVASADGDGPVVVPTLSPSALRKPARITRIERYGAKDAARVVVFVTHPTTFAVGSIPAQGKDRGPRLYIDIHNASYHGKREFAVGGLVGRVRLGQHKKDTRVVLDLGAKVYRKVFYLPEPFRLVVDVSREPPAAMRQQQGPRSVHRVVLDPGHGGHDPGAIGPSGLREKDVTLDIAHRAAPLIARELGIATLLTRDSDDYVPLDERTARANAFQADLFVSIHCNASENADSRGVMTFVLDESRDVLASHVAARENSASPAAAAELANVISHALDAGSVARSVRFAELLQRSAKASLSPGYGNVADQGVKRAGFYVLAGARMPAVLFETTFISNPTGEAHLNTADYRQKIADSIVNAIRAYREGR